MFRGGSPGAVQLLTGVTGNQALPTFVLCHLERVAFNFTVDAKRLPHLHALLPYHKQEKEREAKLQDRLFLVARLGVFIQEWKTPLGLLPISSGPECGHMPPHTCLG